LNSSRRTKVDARRMSSSMKLTGVGASEGVAVGPAFVYVPGELRPERESIPEGVVEM
jgi:phosphoenolpyruvate-protein phosphotransferase (PTS system enzyme I)